MIYMFDGSRFIPVKEIKKRRNLTGRNFEYVNDMFTYNGTSMVRVFSGGLYILFTSDQESFDLEQYINGIGRSDLLNRDINVYVDMNGYTAYSTSTSTPAMKMNGTNIGAGTKVRIYNNNSSTLSYILGMPGNGGNGGASAGTTAYDGSPGGNGGIALQSELALTEVDLLYLNVWGGAGGGGGGGGAYGRSESFVTCTEYRAGGGGGGAGAVMHAAQQAALSAGVGGVASSTPTGSCNLTNDNGGNGTIVNGSPGQGGAGGSVLDGSGDYAYGGSGGNGGDFGQSGSSGANGSASAYTATDTGLGWSGGSGGLAVLSGGSYSFLNNTSGRLKGAVV